MATRMPGRHGAVLHETVIGNASVRIAAGTATFAVAAYCAFAFLTPFAGAQGVNRAEVLHEVCKQAIFAHGEDLIDIITDSDTECVFSARVGSGTATYFNYFSGDSDNNFCVRSVVAVPNAPKYDRTVCGSVPEAKNLAQGIQQGEILKELEGVKEAIRIVDRKVEYVEGTVQLLRKSGTVPVTADIPVEPGDVVLTGKTGFVEIISDGGATWLSGDSTYGIAEIGPTEKPRVIAPDEPLDPQNFQLGELSWWDKIGLYFAGTYNPDVYKTAEMYGIKKAHVVYRGAAYFDEKTDGSSRPAAVVTPTAAIMPNGTAFLVEVEKDGTTTVTTLDGQVLVADLKSGKVVAVNENQAVTVPKTARGLSAKELQQGVTAKFLQPIDRWWFEKIMEKTRRAAAEAAQAGRAPDQDDELKNKIFFVGLAALLIVIGIASSVMRARAAKKK